MRFDPEAGRDELQDGTFRKLEQAGFEEADIGALLDEFEQKTWLSDRRFAESWVADHARRRAASS